MSEKTVDLMASRAEAQEPAEEQGTAKGKGKGTGENGG